MWKYYALLSALFAALTAIFAKIGVKDINSDLATAIRTSVVLCITWGIVVAGNHVGEAKGITAIRGCFSYYREQPRGCRGSSTSRRCRRAMWRGWRR